MVILKLLITVVVPDPNDKAPTRTMCDSSDATPVYHSVTCTIAWESGHTGRGTRGKQKPRCRGRLEHQPHTSAAHDWWVTMTTDQWGRNSLNLPSDTALRSTSSYPLKSVLSILRVSIDFQHNALTIPCNSLRYQNL
ncbi:hypothetical protein J6590_016439 [Homalodisca vitripennis]|nr:hypothetical protein J6590_016439 [Homalodisca vitripennis]